MMMVRLSLATNVVSRLCRLVMSWSVRLIRRVTPVPSAWWRLVRPPTLRVSVWITGVLRGGRLGVLGPLIRTWAVLRSTVGVMIRW